MTNHIHLIQIERGWVLNECTRIFLRLQRIVDVAQTRIQIQKVDDGLAEIVATTCEVKQVDEC